MKKYTSLNVRAETAQRLKSHMKYGQSVDRMLNLLLDNYHPNP